MRNGNSWRLLVLSVPVADTEGEEKDDRLKLTDKGTFSGRQSRKGTAAGMGGSVHCRDNGSREHKERGRVCGKEGC